MPTEKELGSVFDPQVVKAGYRVRFEYEEGCAFEVTLRPDGALDVRASGHHSDILATHHQVSNNLFVVARRFSQRAMRYVDFVNEDYA